MKCYHGQIASLFSIIMLVMSGYAADSGQMTSSEDKNILTTTLNIQTPVEKGVSFLLGRQQEDGSWGSDEKRKLVDSSESLQTLYRVQADENVLGKSLRFFSALTGDNHEILACKLLALANGTAAIDELAEELIAAQLADGGWGISESKTGSIPHTLLAVNALLASNKSSSAIGNGTSFLISSQHSDGSWIFSGAHSLSDTAHTAMALQLLKKVQNRNTFTGSGLDQAIAKAQEYLERHYNSADGSYGDIVDTAWAYLALAGVKQPALLQATLTYLNNAQMADGSWNNKVYDTAVCLRALTAIKTPVQGNLPDLEITSRNISFVPGEPVAGDEVTILTTIYNNGYDIAEGVKVEFFNRDPRVDGIEIANSQTIPLIPDGGSAQVTATFSTKGMKGRVPIMVFVDRANTIPESSKANNSATTYLNVDASEVNLPNLTITALSFSPEEPLAGEAVTALITVENNGKISAPATKLRLTYGNPFSASASVIAEAEVPALDVNASKTISVEFNAADEIANLFAWVDSEETVEEISEDDNVFNQALSEKELPDLIVDASSVSFSHTDLDNGAMVAIHFVVENIGKADATGFKADVTGKQDGQIQKIDSVAIPRLAAGEAIDCTVAWLATTGETEFSISADRNNEVQEITKRNNTANVTKDFTRTVSKIKFYRLIDGEWQESYTFKPYEIMKIVIDSPLDWLYFPKISSNKGSFSYLPTGFLYSIDHQPPGTYTITMELWDLAGEDISSLFLADSVSRDFTLESDFNLNDVTIQAVPSMLRANQLEPVDLSLLIGNRSNIPGRAAGTVKITDPEGTVVLTREISSFETTPGKMEAVALGKLADVFVKEGRYLIETTLIPEEDNWKPVSGKRYYDVFPADTLKITKTLTPRVLDPQNEGKVHVKIDLGSVSSFVEPPPVDLIFLIEESSNLRGEELARSKEIVCQLIDMLPSNARAGAVTYAEWEPSVICPLTYNRQSLKEAVTDSFSDYPLPGYLGSGMEAARLHFIDNTVPGRKRIEVIVSNGYLQYQTDFNPDTFQETQYAQAENITVYTVGIDSVRLNETWLKQIPEATGGRYLFEPSIRDLEFAFKEIFSVSFGVSATNVNISDYFNTKDVELVQNSIIPTPSAIDIENGKITWTLDTISAEKNYSMEFDLLLHNLKPGEERQINKDLTVDFVAPESGANLNINVGEQFIKVKELGTVSIATDKEQYAAKEILQAESKIALIGNQIKRYADWDLKDLNNIVLDADSSRLKLTSTSDTEWRNLVLNGDFELGDKDKSWVLSSRFYIVKDNYLNFSGQWSLTPTVYYGSFCAYQRIKIPMNVEAIELFSKECIHIYDEYPSLYKICIADINGIPYRRLYETQIGDKSIVSHHYELDPKEWAGKTVDLQFHMNGSFTEGSIDDVELNVTQTICAPVGTACFIIDGENPVIWDKLKHQSEVPEGTSIKFRVRGANEKEELSEAAWSEYFTGGDSSIPEQYSRFLELEVTMTAERDSVSPELSDLAVTYISYKPEDDLHVKVDIRDAEGAVAYTFHELRPNLQLGRNQSFNLTWNTANTLPGMYTANAELYVRGEKNAEGQDEFEILPGELSATLDGSVTTDKLEYSGNETVRITSRVNNLSANSPISSLAVNVKITNLGNEVLMNEDYVIGSLLPNSLDTKALTFAVTNELPLGDYTVIQTVTTGENEVLTRQATFKVSASVDLGKGLSGTITPQPVSVKRRIGDLNFDLTAQNSGNVDLTGVVFKVTVFDPETMAQLKTFRTLGIAMPKAASHNDTLAYGSKVELQPGAYPVALTAEYTYEGVAKNVPLDSAGFVVTNAAPVANAGSDRQVEADSAAGASVALDGSASTDENSTDSALKNDIVKYEWKLGDQVIGTGETMTTTLPAGENSVTLTVTDSCGLSSNATVKITVVVTSVPKITDLSPANGTITQDSAIGATVTDAISGIDWTSIDFRAGEEILTASYNEETGRITSSLPVQDGWYDLVLKVKNLANRETTSPTWRICLDRTAPVVSNQTPGNGSETENKAPEISVVISDTLSGIDSSTIELKLDGTAVAHTYDGNTGKVSFLASELTEAEHNITLTVKDKSGNESSASWSFTVVAPAVPGISGALTLNPETVKRRIGDLSLAVLASNTGNVELNGVTFTVKLMNTSGDAVLKEFSEAGSLPLEGIYSKTYTYGSKVELAPGIYPVTLAATYTFGGKEQSVTLDTKQLTVTNTAPVANAGPDQAVTATSPTGAEITLNGSASWDENSTDGARKNDIVRYEWKEGETKLGENEILTVTLVPGVHEITLTVIDSCGAAHSDTVKVTVNRIILPPSISELAPAHETITKELALSAKATDAVWGIDWTTLVFKAGETVLAATHDSETGAIVSALPSDSPDGWYDLNIFIKNLGGGEATTETWRVGLDRTAPVIMELKPEADAYTSTAAPTISAKITDAMSGVEPAGIVVKVGDTVLESAYDAEKGVVTAVVPDALADGWQTVRIDAADKVGNTGSAEWRIGIDIMPPTITGMIPTADSVIDQTSQEISVVVSDETSGINADTIAMSIDGSAVMFTHAETTGKVSFNATGLTSGIHTVTVAVSDKAGNSSNATWKFNVELEIPESKYLLFHNSKSGELDISGGNKMINGIAHSNAAIKVRGNHTAITGKTTAVGAISVKGKDHNIALQQSNAPEVVMPVYPYEYYVANATQVHNGDWSVGKGQNVPAGIHLVNGNVTVQGDINASVTIVATGNITIKSQTVNLTSADTQYKVALYSRDGNISFSSNGVSVNGIIYAPGGTCKVSSNGSNFTGGIIADMIDFSGQNLTLNPFDYAGGEE